MAQHYFSFAGLTAGTQPPDTTERYVSGTDYLVRDAAGSTDGKRVEIVGPTNGSPQALSFDAADGSGTIEVVGRVLADDVDISDRAIGLFVRGGGAAAS